ncbi:transcription termination factor NusA [Candidatus Fermentibacterales bacterium]|nr:transcription termination factor NusA [Candidatus Fermentibacterales bacterium]
MMLSGNYERIEALARLFREKGLSRDVLLTSLLSGLRKATEREYGSESDLRVDWDSSSGDVSVVVMKEVVDRIASDRQHDQITLRKARKIVPEAKLGDTIPVAFDFIELSRSAINIFRQEFLSLVRQAERKDIYAEYKDRVGQLIPRCRVQQVYKNRILVQVAGRVEAVVPAEERARGERYEQGDPVLPVLLEVNEPDSSEPQLILSRATPLLVKRLFEREAPEIEEGVVEIRAIAREAGVRTKIAVASNDHRVDAVGAFVGIKGSRVQAVTRELNGERIDIIPWTMDKRVLATHALQPAAVIHTESKTWTDPETGAERPSMMVVVPDSDLSLAIGKNGQNVRLAGEMVGYRIDLMTQTEWEKENRWRGMLKVDLPSFSSMSDKLAEKLRLSGLDSAQSILEGGEKKLLSVKGIGPATAARLLAEAKVLAEERVAEVERLRQETERKEMEAAALAESQSEGQQPAEEDPAAEARKDSGEAGGGLD